MYGRLWSILGNVKNIHPHLTYYRWFLFISGEGLSSIYTYNGITCLRCGTWGVVTGTEGGKLEVWCVATAQQLTFVNAFQNQVTTLFVSDTFNC